VSCVFLPRIQSYPITLVKLADITSLYKEFLSFKEETLNLLQSIIRLLIIQHELDIENSEEEALGSGKERADECCSEEEDGC